MSVLRVGVVEDNDLDFYALRRGLAARQLSRWIDGQDLLRALKEDASLLAGVDVLLLDLGLPVTDGVQVARTVRALGGNELSIILLCGALPPLAVMQQLEEVVDEIRIKPANRRDLAALNDCLDELNAVLQFASARDPLRGRRSWLPGSWGWRRRPPPPRSSTTPTSPAATNTACL